jgi:hypothetical protein
MNLPLPDAFHTAKFLLLALELEYPILASFLCLQINRLSVFAQELLMQPFWEILPSAPTQNSWYRSCPVEMLLPILSTCLQSLTSQATPTTYPKLSSD